MENIIKTITNNGYAEIVEKKSKFITNVSPAKTEEEAKTFIEDIKKKYYDARHNVFAYNIGDIKRFSDDGEPQGTAGMPTLNVILNEDIKNIVVVTTRYFGGILLGKGGLVRAYTSAAKEGIKNAGVSEIGIYSKIIIKCPYTLSGKIEYELRQGEYFVENTEFTDEVKFTVFVENSFSEKFKNIIKDITSAAADVNEIEILRGTCTLEGFKKY